MDVNALDGVWKLFTRIRVKLDVEKPLKRRLKIKPEGDSWSWINFKYERLGTFCFICGILGHSERDCNVLYANPDKVVEKVYGVWLRAPSKNAEKLNTGARWLRNTGGVSNTWMKGDGCGTPSSVNQDGGQGQTKFMEVDGVVRENLGDQGGIAVKGRDYSVIDGNNITDDSGSITMERDKVVYDPKRKRLEEKVEETRGENCESLSIENQKNESLNLQMAGPVAQARLGL